ncbi:MAG TPA: archaeal heat shock protein Hsp20 [Thermoplasmataceae archaeon]|nr:Hsp20/alpha crystallin family protein [Thermoplasmatales archaeon AK]HLH86311.1 archaeal heat shock protein Hsp20 [Thermoplasmataceae archaeon]
MVIRRRRDVDDWRDDWKDDFESFFEDFGFDFDRFNERIRRIWDRLLKDPEVKTYGPYVYGFTYKIGPDGRPVFEEFGNVPGRLPGMQPQMEKDVREPITDLNEDQSKVYITYELPGISKEDIDLNVSERNVTLTVKNGPRKYYKSIDFDYELKTDSARAKFTNGILDVTIEKAKKDSQSGKKVSIQ